jgi:hypothetical protein
MVNRYYCLKKEAKFKNVYIYILFCSQEKRARCDRSKLKVRDF